MKQSPLPVNHRQILPALLRHLFFRQRIPSRTGQSCHSRRKAMAARLPDQPQFLHMGDENFFYKRVHLLFRGHRLLSVIRIIGMEVPRLKKLIGNLKLCKIRIKASLRKPGHKAHNIFKRHGAFYTDSAVPAGSLFSDLYRVGPHRCRDPFPLPVRPQKCKAQLF